MTLLWIFVIGLRQGEMSLNLPIEYYSIPNHFALSVETPKRDQRSPAGVPEASFVLES